MAVAIALDLKNPQQLDGLSTGLWTSASSRSAQVNVTTGPRVQLAEESLLSTAVVLHAYTLPKSHLGVVDKQSLSESKSATTESKSTCGSFGIPFQNVPDHGWTRFSQDITFNFAKLVKDEYGEDLVSPLTVAFHAPVLPSKTLSEHKHRTIDLSPISSSSRAHGDFKSGENSPARASSASEKKTKTVEQKAKSFASLPDRLEWILPKDMIARLLKDSSFCVNENVKPKKRCSRRAKTPYRSSVEVQCMLRGVDFNLGEQALVRLILDVMSKCLCAWHLNPRIPVLSKLGLDLGTMLDDEKAIFRGWINTLLQTPGATEEATGHSKQVSTTSGSKTSQDTIVNTESSTSPSRESPFTRSMAAQLRQNVAKPGTSVGQVLANGYLQQWREYRPNATCTPSGLIKNLLTRPLKSSEWAAGYIYMYWYPPNFGYLKIGRTEKSPETSFKEWEKQCKHPVADANRHSRFVKHVALVEKLVHAELRDRRVQEIGCVCRKIHHEWFLVNPVQALKVVDKFAKYMDQAPYGSTKADPSRQPNTDKGVFDTDLRQLCQLVDTDPLKKVIGPKPDPRRRSMGRRRST
jgi:hypothetical protein